MLMKIVPKFLNKIKEYQNIDYLAFWKSCLKSWKNQTWRPPTWKRLQQWLKIKKRHTQNVCIGFDYWYWRRTKLSRTRHANKFSSLVSCLNCTTGNSRPTSRSSKYKQERKRNDWQMRKRLCAAIKCRESILESNCYHEQATRNLCKKKIFTYEIRRKRKNL